MTSRERVLKTLNHEPVDRAPRHLWTLPYLKADLNRFFERFPDDITFPDARLGKSRYAQGTPFMPPGYVDDFGSEWHVKGYGVTGEVRNSPLFDWSGLDTYEFPWEMLKEADFSRVNESCADTDKFVLAGTQARPFERLQFFRGTENLYMDLAYGDERLYKLIDMMQEFNLAEIEMWAKTDVDAVSFMDDWGSQTSLLISPKMWREIFKPLYKSYCDILKSAGKKVFFHSDGNIFSIYPDLIEIGIDAINSQLFCMDIEEIGESFSGKITFWGEIDRQKIIPFGTEEDARIAVRRVRKALDKGNGGVIAEVEWGHDAKEENIYAIFEEWEKESL